MQGLETHEEFGFFFSVEVMGGGHKPIRYLTDALESSLCLLVRG